MEIKHEVKLHNRFDIEVIDSKTGEIKQKAFAENIILNALWARLITDNASYFNYIAYGTGTGTLAASRTSLFTHLGLKQVGDPVYALNENEGWVSMRRSITLLETENNGSTLTEVGISSGNSSTNLVTHAMIKDMNGNTVSIAKTATDIINIYATIYTRFSGGVWMGGKLRYALTINSMRGDAYYLYDSILNFVMGRTGNTSTGFIAFMGASGYTAVLGTGGINGSSLGYGYVTAATKTKDINNKRLTFYARCPATSANSINGILSVLLFFNNLETYGANYAPFILNFPNSNYAGTAISGEAVGTGNGVTKDFATAFPLVQSGAVVKINGSAATATVDTLKPTTADITRYLRTLTVAVTNYSWFVSSLLAGEAYTSVIQPTGMILENPYYQSFGITALKLGANGRLFASDDLSTWDLVLTSDNSTTERSVPAPYQNKRYWKVLGSESTNSISGPIKEVKTTNYSATNIHFATAPANGSTITVDYTTDVVAKDANHVFDVTFTLQFAEWTA